jgi:hypothetical protein
VLIHSSNSFSDDEQTARDKTNPDAASSRTRGLGDQPPHRRLLQHRVTGTRQASSTRRGSTGASSTGAPSPTDRPAYRRNVEVDAGRDEYPEWLNNQKIVDANPDLHEWHTVTYRTRLPGREWGRTLWLATLAGGPFEYTGREMRDAHFELKISPEVFDEVAAELPTPWTSSTCASARRQRSWPASPAKIASQTVDGEHFAVTVKVESLYSKGQSLPADAIGPRIARIRRDHFRLLGNGYCTRPPELECRCEAVFGLFVFLLGSPLVCGPPKCYLLPTCLPDVPARFSVEERSLKIIMLAAVALFVVGAIAEARDTHTVWGQGGMFWMLLGFAAVALEFAVPRYAGRLHRR